jgi:hypothetical protein
MLITKNCKILQLYSDALLRLKQHLFLSLYSNMGPVFRDIGKRMAGLSAAQTKISSQVGKIEEWHLSCSSIYILFDVFFYVFLCSL